MKVVFMGTPDFSVPALLRLIKEHEVVCVYTREPKLAGRGKELSKTPIHLVAEQNGIEVRTPKTLRNEEEQKKFAELKADIAVVTAYGLILPKPILTAFPLGCLNIHASLLPRWRGAAPIQRAIEAGDKKSGITIMQMDEGLDTGDMLLKGEVEIDEKTTGEILHDKMSLLGADLISQVLSEPSKYKPTAQTETGTCYAQKIEKSESKIDFELPADVLCRKIKAFSPYPAMFFEYNGERFKILFAEEDSQNGEPGEILAADDTLKIACADGSIRITKIQRQGKKSMDIGELLRGYTFTKGAKI